MYNTDDLGRIDTGGCLLHLGRKDFQVKIRGNSVELAEIEMALRQIEEVTDTVVIDTPATSGEQRQFYRPALGECGFLQRISWFCSSVCTATALSRQLHRIQYVGVPAMVVRYSIRRSGNS